MTHPLEDVRMRQDVCDVHALSDQPTGLAYSLSKSVEERLEAIEIRRMAHYRYGPTTERLQRVVRYAQLGE